MSFVINCSFWNNQKSHGAKLRQVRRIVRITVGTISVRLRNIQVIAGVYFLTFWYDWRVMDNSLKTKEQTCSFVFKESWVGFFSWLKCTTTLGYWIHAEINIARGFSQTGGEIKIGGIPQHRMPAIMVRSKWNVTIVEKADLHPKIVVLCVYGWIGEAPCILNSLRPVRPAAPSCTVKHRSHLVNIKGIVFHQDV